MTQVSDIAWGKYQGLEGPVFWGSRAMDTPNSNATENERLVFIMTHTEGAKYDQCQSYDSCILSGGLFQWCEKSYFLTSSMLGALAQVDPNLLAPLAPALAASNAVFKRNANGKWRFFFLDERGEVDTIVEQKQLFLLNSTGLKGSWDDVSKAHAKLWLSCVANTLAQEDAISIQVDFCASRVMGFATADAKQILFDPVLPSTGWTGALRAVYLSFAGNLPAVADKQLKIALASTTDPKWSPNWCIHVMKQLAFGPQIAIFPGRYEKIRPLVEKYYGVDLPDFAKDLQAWRGVFDAEGKPKPSEPLFEKVEDIQALLLALGLDLGPSGADGRMGGKTKDALMVFQRQNGLESDGLVGPKTRAKLLQVWRSLQK